MKFAAPQMLSLLAVTLPLLAWFLWWAWRKKQALMTRFIQARLLPQLTVRMSALRQKIRLALIGLAVTCAFLALARPQWGFKWEEAKTRGLDIVVAIDTSRSMLAPDIQPNRLTRAKLAALDLMRLARNDRLGLVAFAGTAFLQCPLTLDDEAFRQSVELLSTDIIPQGGSALAEAIQVALTAFKEEEGDNFKVLVLFSDGEDHESGALEAAKTAAKDGLIIYTVGVGTPEGELLQVTEENGRKTFVKDDAGNVVKSRLNETLLTQIATETKGFYLNLRGAKTIETLFEHERGLRSLPKSDISAKFVQAYYERYQWPLALAILCLIAELLLPHPQRARRAGAEPEVEPAARAGLRQAVALLCLLALPWPGAAGMSSAHRNYDQGNYLAARKEYERLLQKKPDDPRLHYNAGAAAYKAKDFDAATKDFGAALTSPDLKVQQQAYYNFGNALYRQGQRAGEPNQQFQSWSQAVRSYESALKLDPNDEDAKFNLELVKKKLEALKKETNPNQPSQDQKDQREKEDKEDEQDQQQRQNQQPDEQEQKEDSDKEQQPKPDKEDKQDEQKDADQQPEQQAGEQAQSDAEQQSQAAAQRGEMTPEQAQQLLDSQKAEERALIFRPPEKQRSKARVFKDW
jgi:Ca-activated chloride channel family protein